MYSTDDRLEGLQLSHSPLHDELTNTVAHKLKIAGLIALGATVPMIVLLVVLRSVLKPVALQQGQQPLARRHVLSLGSKSG